MSVDQQIPAGDEVIVFHVHFDHHDLIRFAEGKNVSPSTCLNDDKTVFIRMPVATRLRSGPSWEIGPASPAPTRIAVMSCDSEEGVLKLRRRVEAQSALSANSEYTAALHQGEIKLPAPLLACSPEA
ncbi:hypothetical protein [Rhizobium mesoamericanum]|uniref:hypothetical protein n=1 Tax=Rhizobium mesoamericanum TaxID=1079800 RepID=UPI0012F755AF|nr:hypothetical protein [Rhizobium mesoamericanum]